MAVLVNIIISAILGIIGIELITTIYYLAVILPGIAITVRRLRDAGINRPWIFIAFFPPVGWIIFIVKLCKPSVEENEFIPV